jgi:hypothetical protein
MIAFAGTSHSNTLTLPPQSLPSTANRTFIEPTSIADLNPGFITPPDADAS